MSEYKEMERSIITGKMCMASIVMSNRCPACRKKIKPNTKVCPHCGAFIGGVTY